MLDRYLDAVKLHDTTSLCPTCLQGIDAGIWQIDNKIVMDKKCLEHGQFEVLISSDAEWYHNALTTPAVLTAPAVVKKDVVVGCPYDCGACTSHEQKVYLPVVPITSACNLNCPICYTINKNDNAFHMSLSEFGKILDVIRENDPEMKIINLTGGEPTLHPQLTSIIKMCHDAGIHRVTISTHGLTFIKNEQVLADLAALRARIVLSFNSFNEEINDKMLGAKLLRSKLQVLEQLEKYDVDTTLIPVLALGYNDHEIGDLINLALEKDFIRSLEIHTMTFTGQGGRGFEANARMTVPDVLASIEESTKGKIRMRDFVPSPCAHPLCYQTCYLLETDDRDFVPFARFISKDNIRHLLTDNLYMEPGEKMEVVLQNIINELWAGDSSDKTTAKVLKQMKHLLKQLFPARPIAYHERQRIVERSAKTIYIHSHMDEENFDTDRIRQCCVGVPAADGTNIPTCSYNILYRARDQRFSAAEISPLSSFNGGDKKLVQIGRR